VTRLLGELKTRSPSFAFPFAEIARKSLRIAFGICAGWRTTTALN
jgi:hypothetical protein